MTELGDLTAPIVSAATGLHGHRAGRERGQERQKLAAAQLLAKDHRARAVSPMKLKDVLGEIESDGANLVHGRLLEWALTPPLWHADAVGGVHTIRPLATACAAHRFIEGPARRLGMMFETASRPWPGRFLKVAP